MVGINSKKVDVIPAPDSVDIDHTPSSNKTVKIVLYCPRHKNISFRRRNKKIKKKMAPSLPNLPQRKTNLNDFHYGPGRIILLLLCGLMVYAIAPALQLRLTTVAGKLLSFVTAAQTSFKFHLPTFSSQLGQVAQEARSITTSTPESVIGDLLGWTHRSEGATWNLHDTCFSPPSHKSTQRSTITPSYRRANHERASWMVS